MKRLQLMPLTCGLMMTMVGCGQKGPLYLPDHNVTVVTRPAGSSSPGTPPASQQGTPTLQSTPLSTPAPEGPADQTSSAQSSATEVPSNTAPANGALTKPDDQSPDSDSPPPK